MKLPRIRFPLADDPWPEIPIALGWEPLVKVEHYHVGADAILKETMNAER